MQNHLGRSSKTNSAKTGGVASARKSTFGRDEVAHLAYLNWRHDGCPMGRDFDYWVEAEAQLKATNHLLIVAEVAPAAAKTLKADCSQNLAVSARLQERPSSRKGYQRQAGPCGERPRVG
jgi:hypothetical protein